MELRKTIRTVVALALIILSLHGCQSRPELLPRSSAAPEGVDFSGQWELRPNTDSAGGTWPDRGPGANQSIEAAVRKKRQKRTRRSSGSSIHLFLETGKSLKITQTDHGFFVSIDRSVVEEFTFGENRIVSVGPIEAHRVSGWEGDIYVVETLDEAGVILKEAWYLDDSANVLLRDVSIVERSKQKFLLQQKFDRQ